MLTVSELARRCGLSRSALLYYESIGLLKAAGRTAGNYRKYGEKDVQRLEQICVYRNAGLTLDDIRQLLGRPETGASAVLKRRLAALDVDIGRLRDHQRALLKLLSINDSFWRRDIPMTKETFVSVLKGAGFTEDDMHRLHQQFERSAPEEHQKFLEYLNIPEEEIRQIREASR